MKSDYNIESPNLIISDYKMCCCVIRLLFTLTNGTIIMSRCNQLQSVYFFFK